MYRLLKYRFFIEVLVKNEFKKRYTQSALGTLWMIIEPLILVVTLSLIFTFIGREGPKGSDFPVFFYSGLFLWNIFGSALSAGPGAFLQDKSILSKVNYPRQISAIRAVSIYFFEFLFSLVSFVGVLLFYGVKPTLSWLLLPLFVIFTLALSYNLTLFLGTLNVYQRDVGILSRSLKSVWFWFTPIIFYFEKGTVAEYLYYINPMAGIIGNVRNIMVFQEPLNYMYLICPTVWLIGLWVVGRSVFSKLERGFLDVI